MALLEHRSDMMDAAGLLTAVTLIRRPEANEKDVMSELLSTKSPTRAELETSVALPQSSTARDYFMRFEVWRNPAGLHTTDAPVASLLLNFAKTNA